MSTLLIECCNNITGFLILLWQNQIQCYPRKKCSSQTFSVSLIRNHDSNAFSLSSRSKKNRQSRRFWKWLWYHFLFFYFITRFMYHNYFLNVDFIGGVIKCLGLTMGILIERVGCTYSK